MTQPTDDIAAQMVREIQSALAYKFCDIKGSAEDRAEVIARRYMEKLFSEDELRRMFVIASDYWGFVTDEDSFAADMRVNKIRAERAGKAER